MELNLGLADVVVMIVVGWFLLMWQTIYWEQGKSKGVRVLGFLFLRLKILHKLEGTEGVNE